MKYNLELLTVEQVKELMDLWAFTTEQIKELIDLGKISEQEVIHYYCNEWWDEVP